MQHNIKTKFFPLYFKRFLIAAKITGENVKQIGLTEIKSHMIFFCVYKIASSGARANALCESYCTVAYKLQLDMVAVQIS